MKYINSLLPIFPKINIFAPSQYFSEPSLNKIKNFAKSAFVELALALTLNLTFNFIRNSILPDDFHLMTCISGIALLTLGIIKLNPINTSFSNNAAAAARSLARLSIIHTATMKLYQYIHEYGHVGAALLCYLNADPKIHMRWKQPTTSYNISYGLTCFGTYLGEHNSRMVVTCAGLLTPSLCALHEFAVAHYLNEEFPALAEMLNYQGLSQLFALSIYGLSAFLNAKTMNSENDFIALWVMGDLHPAICLSFLVGVPILEFVVLKYLRTRKLTATSQEE